MLWRPTSTRGKPRAAEPPTAPAFHGQTRLAPAQTQGRLWPRARAGLPAAAAAEAVVGYPPNPERWFCGPGREQWASFSPPGWAALFQGPRDAIRGSKLRSRRGFRKNSQTARTQRCRRSFKSRLIPRPPLATGLASHFPAAPRPLLRSTDRPSGSMLSKVSSISYFQKSHRPGRTGAWAEATRNVQCTKSSRNGAVGQLRLLLQKFQGRRRKRFQGSARHR